MDSPSDCPLATSPLIPLPVTVQLPTIGLFHILVLLLMVHCLLSLFYSLVGSIETLITPIDFGPLNLDDTIGDTVSYEINMDHPDLGPKTSGAGQPEEFKSIQPDPLVQEPDNEDPGGTIHLPKLEMTQCFIDTLKGMSLEDSGMQHDNIEIIQNPGPVLDLADLLPLLRSLRHFINNANASQAHLNGIHKIKLLRNLSSEFLSFDQIKCRLHWLSGVTPLEHNMCPKSCIAYTGPYKEL
ncbi:hypothetical protein EI94DRAFT_1800233 [Lactarius quietus]|nr:hypothetical protein EI94DRAFT_1800233 [Lactarius quietus]